MQIPFPFNLVTSLLLLSFIFLLVNKWQKSKTKNHQKLPPGPWKFPLIGHLHHILGSLPHHSFANLSKKYGPLMHLKLGEVSTIVVSSPLFAKEVLKNHDPSCADRPETLASKIMWNKYSDIAFCPYGNYWRQMRKICIVELLSSKNVRSFESIRLDEASGLVESIQSSSQEVPINLSEKIFFYISSITCRAAFGKVCRDPDTLINVLKNTVVLAGGFGFADLFPSSKMLNIFSWNKLKLSKMHRKLDSILEDIIDEHQQKSANGSGESGDEDLVDVFLRLKNSRTLEFPIENENIKAIIFKMKEKWMDGFI